MGEKHELVSVIILYYNQPMLVYDAIKSVLEQSYENIELIIADDCSREMDADAITEYVSRNRQSNLAHFEILSHRQNVGTVKNINRAIVKSTGKYIKIFAADDVIANNAVISEQVNRLKSCDGLIVTGKLMQCDEQLRSVRDKSVERNNADLQMMLNMDPQKRERYIYKHNLFPYCTQSMLFSRKFFDKYGLYDETYQLIEDTPLMWRILDEKISVAYLDDFVIKHRVDTGVTAKSISIHSERYVNDCIIQLETTKRRNAGILCKLDCICRIKIFRMRGELTEDEKSGNKLAVILKYIPYELLFVCLHPKKMLSIIGINQ